MALSHYGICSLSHVPVRRAPKHQAEMVSELLFGELYQVLEESEDKNWLLVENSFDKYRGWLHRGQHEKVEANYVSKYLESEHLLVNAPLASISKITGEEVILSAASVLPFYQSAQISLGHPEGYFFGENKSIHKLTVPDETALLYLNAPYTWGGRSIFGIDCSGLLQQVFRLHGVQFPRDAYQQAELGEPLTAFSEARPGDVAFFNLRKDGKVDHVGIVMSRNRIIHAYGKVRIDWFDETGIKNIDTGTYSHTFSFFRRIDYIQHNV